MTNKLAPNLAPLKRQAERLAAQLSKISAKLAETKRQIILLCDHPKEMVYEAEYVMSNLGGVLHVPARVPCAYCGQKLAVRTGPSKFNPNYEAWSAICDSLGCPYQGVKSSEYGSKTYLFKHFNTRYGVYFGTQST